MIISGVIRSDPGGSATRYLGGPLDAHLGQEGMPGAPGIASPPPRPPWLGTCELRVAPWPGRGVPRPEPHGPAAHARL